MMREVRTITHDGMTLTVGNWANRVGIKRQTLDRRLSLGWPLDKALSKEPSSVFSSANKAATKNDAEMYLNDCGPTNLPGRIFRVCNLNGKVDKRPGTYVRSHHPSLFDEFYLGDFSLRHHGT